MTAQGPPSVRSEHDVRVAMCFHGLLAAWKGRHAPPAADQAVNATRSLAKFAAASIHKHVLSPARAAGVAVAVFIHSWNPELAGVLDALYAPAASLHEPPQLGLKPVRSQHLSMHRAISMVPPQVALIMVSRLDLLFYTDLHLAQLLVAANRRPMPPAIAPSLWLPHTCQLNIDAPPAEQRAIQAECGCRVCTRETAGGCTPGGHVPSCKGPNGLGTLVEAPSLERLGVRWAKPEAQHGMYVLDWWFVATADIARSFTQLTDNFTYYDRAVRRRARGELWAHQYWAHHITHVLPPRAAPRFLLLDGQDFTLARFVRRGTSCSTPIHMPARILRTLNKTVAKLTSWLVPDALADQCPAALRHSSTVMCPWYTPACPVEHAEAAAAAIKRAESALRLEGLRPEEHLYDRNAAFMHRLVHIRWAHVRADDSITRQST